MSIKNSKITTGKVGRGKSFFEKAFGANEEEFNKLLYMPEVMIIYRLHYEQNGLTEKWWNAFNNLSDEELNSIKPIIETNDFSKIDDVVCSKKAKEVLSYYTISRNDAEREIQRK